MYNPDADFAPTTEQQPTSTDPLKVSSGRRSPQCARPFHAGFLIEVVSSTFSPLALRLSDGSVVVLAVGPVVAAVRSANRMESQQRLCAYAW